MPYADGATRRQFHEKFTMHPWKRIAVEAATIVASILLAIAIDAWWQNRQVRVDEQEVLVGLRAEFAANRETLARHLAGYLRSIQSLEVPGP